MAQITIDDVEGRQVPLFALRTNVEKLKELDRRWNKTVWEGFELHLRASKVIHGLFKKVLLLLVFTGGISMYLTAKTLSATTFAISMLLMCLFGVGMYIYVSMAKSSITRMNWFIVDIMKKCNKLKADASVLLELEKNRIKGQAANVVDNNEDPIVDMDYFISSTKYICDDATDFSNFEKEHYMYINISSVLGGINFAVVLFTLYCNFYYRNDSSSPQQSSLGGHPNKPTENSIGWNNGCFLLIYEKIKYCISV